MKKIITVVGTSKEGKTTSIILAAKLMKNSGAKLIARYSRWRADIIEIYEVNKANKTLYVAYISKGDNCEEIEGALVKLDEMLAEATANSGVHIELDVIVIACHPNGRKYSALKSVIKPYATKHSYEILLTSPFIVKIKPEKYKTDLENCMNSANEACASFLNSLVLHS
jgi:allophanate hydrolase subunit 1